MAFTPSSLKTRRQFIRQAACAALGTWAVTNTIRDLRLVNAAMAQTTVSDYKALVCVFLQGGNDSNNLIIPTLPGEYKNYAAIRSPVLAIPASAVLPLNSLNSDGHRMGCIPVARACRLSSARKSSRFFLTRELSFTQSRARNTRATASRRRPSFSLTPIR